MVEWIEVKGPTVDLAVQVAMTELNVTDREGVEVEVLEQPDKGFLGIGRKDAVVRVKKRPATRKRGRSRGKGQGRSRGKGDGRSKPSDSGGRQPGRERGSNGAGNRGGKGDGRDQRRQQPTGQRQKRDPAGGPKGKGDAQRGRKASSTAKSGDNGPQSRGKRVSEGPNEEVDTGQQAEVVKEFLEGLLNAFGLEGTVDVRVDEEIIYADVNGEQTEALIGEKATIMYAIHELVRTVVQRKTMAGARVRLDIGGYGERRRQALTVYAGRLAEQVLEEGDEIMLEAMNPADRKVVHDAIGEIEGVESYSEGEDPRRSVVIAPAGD